VQLLLPFYNLIRLRHTDFRSLIGFLRRFGF